MEEEDIDDGPSSSSKDSVKDLFFKDNSDRKLHNKLMRQALNYQNVMKGQSKTRNEMGEEMFFDSMATMEDPFSTATETKGYGMSVYANPYLEIFNVATTTAGVYPFVTNSTEERNRIQQMPEPIFLTSCIDIENEEEMENDDSANENTTELTKMPLDIIKPITVTRHLKPTVATSVLDDGVDPPHSTDNNGLSAMMKLYICQTVDTQIENWKKQGKLQNASKEKIDELMHHLQKKACSVLSTKIRSYIIGGDSNNMVDEPITEESTDALRRSPRLRKKNEFKHC